MRKQFINGIWVDANNAGVWDVMNPATDELICTIQFGDGTDCKLAIDAAQNAFKTWSVISPWTRAEILKNCLLYTSPSPRDRTRSRMPSSA